MASKAENVEFPLVCIGMPVLNGGWRVRRALRSLVNQTYRPIQIVISNNFSDDGTAEVVDDFARGYDHVGAIHQTRRVTALDNFLAVLRGAESPYFMWAAHDDYWEPDFVEACVRALQHAPEAEFAMARSRIESDFSRVLSFSPKDLDFIELEDPKARVMYFTAQPFGDNHKDNIVYALWRRKALEHSLLRICQILSYVRIGGCMCEYILAHHRGVLVRGHLKFRKYYAKIPPGSSLDRVLTRTRFALGLRRRSVSKERRFIDELRAVLLATNLGKDFIEDVVRANIYHMDTGRSGLHKFNR